MQPVQTRFTTFAAAGGNLVQAIFTAPSRMLLKWVQVGISFSGTANNDTGYVLLSVSEASRNSDTDKPYGFFHARCAVNQLSAVGFAAYVMNHFAGPELNIEVPQGGFIYLVTQTVTGTIGGGICIGWHPY